MKLLFFLPLLFAVSSANDEITEIERDVLISALKKLEGTKINLPQELVDKLNLNAETIDERAIGITAAVDKYVDNILVNINKFIIRSGLDPAELPDATLNLIPTGTITLTSGWLQDTSTIQRNGNATVTYSSSTRAMELYLPIKFSALLELWALLLATKYFFGEPNGEEEMELLEKVDLYHIPKNKVTYKYHTKALLLSIKGDANGKIENVIINVRLTYDFSTYQASLETFEIKDSGRMSLKFSGNGLVDWLTNTMTSVVSLFLQPIIIRIIQSMIKGGLESVVDAFNDIIISIFNP